MLTELLRRRALRWPPQNDKLSPCEQAALSSKLRATQLEYLAMSHVGPFTVHACASGCSHSAPHPLALPCQLTFCRVTAARANPTW